MHLWPSARIRDSFKHSYLSKLELNLHRMKQDKKQTRRNKVNSNRAPLLEPANGEAGEEDDEGNKKHGAWCLEVIGVAAKDMVLLLTCCFCCGACCNGEEDK